MKLDRQVIRTRWGSYEVNVPQAESWTDLVMICGSEQAALRFINRSLCRGARDAGKARVQECRDYHTAMEAIRNHQERAPSYKPGRPHTKRSEYVGTVG